MQMTQIFYIFTFKFAFGSSFHCALCTVHCSLPPPLALLPRKTTMLE